MPAGDAQRTWFPEIVDTLKREWDPRMSCTTLIALRDRLNDMLQAIRRERNILPPMMQCSNCGTKNRSAPPQVSVRAMILALGRFRIAPAAKVKELEREWTKYRINHRLDLYGEDGNV